MKERPNRDPFQALCWVFLFYDFINKEVRTWHISIPISQWATAALTDTPLAALRAPLAGRRPMRGRITRVNGENGVDALRMAPRSELLAMDISRSDALIGWYVKTDDAGYKSKTPYLLTPYEPQPAQGTADLTSIEERLTRLEGIINEQSLARQPEGKPKSGKTE